MRRSEAHQGVRMIVFRGVLSRYEANEVSQLEAAELLGISERTFRRWCQRFEDEGEAGLLDRRLGRVSGKRVPLEREQEVERLYRTRYSGFTARHFHDHLVRDHGFRWGYTWTKVFLQSKGLLERAAQSRAASRSADPRKCARTSSRWRGNSSATGSRSAPSPGPSTFIRRRFTGSSRGSRPYAGFLFRSAAQAYTRASPVPVRGSLRKRTPKPADARHADDLRAETYPNGAPYR